MYVGRRALLPIEVHIIQVVDLLADHPFVEGEAYNPRAPLDGGVDESPARRS